MAANVSLDMDHLTTRILLSESCSGPQCRVLGKDVGLGTSLHEQL